MKFLFDLLPVLLFFGTYKLAGRHEQAALEFASSWLGQGIQAAQAPILIATAVAIFASFLQLAWAWVRHRRVDTALWVSVVVIALFGGATLFFHDPTFFKWKPTVIYWMFGLTLTLSALVFNRNLMRRMLGAQISLPDAVWARLNGAWAGFFLVMGGLNLVVAYGFSEETWVNFKLFGGTGLMLAFVVAQGFYLSRHLEEETS